MSETTRPIRVLIADDHPLIRKGLRVTLEDASGIQVVGEAKNGAEVQQLVAQRSPRVLVLDLIMPDTRSLEVAAWVRRHYPDTIILVLTAHDRCDYLARMIEVGVAGYIGKGAAESVIVDAVWRAVRGESLITEEQMARAHNWHKTVREPWESLTNREQQVLRLLAEGADYATIAERLCVTTKTIERHATGIFRKLGVSSRAKAAAWLLKHVPDDLYEFQDEF